MKVQLNLFIFACLLFAASPALAQDRDAAADAGVAYTGLEINDLNERIKVLEAQIAQITSTVEGLRRIHNPTPKAPDTTKPQDPKPNQPKPKTRTEKAKAAWKKTKETFTKLKNKVKVPRRQITKNTVRSSLELMAAFKSRLEADKARAASRKGRLLKLQQAFIQLKAKPDKALYAQSMANMAKLQEPNVPLSKQQQDRNRALARNLEKLR